MKENPAAPYHRRTLDETCRVCQAPKHVECIDLRRKGTPVVAMHQHRYRPTQETET